MLTYKSAFTSNAVTKSHIEIMMCALQIFIYMVLEHKQEYRLALVEPWSKHCRQKS